MWVCRCTSILGPWALPLQLVLGPAPSSLPLGLVHLGPSQILLGSVPWAPPLINSSTEHFKYFMHWLAFSNRHFFILLSPCTQNYKFLPLWEKKKKKLAAIYSSNKGKKWKGGGKMQGNGKIYYIIAVQDICKQLENTPLSSTWTWIRTSNNKCEVCKFYSEFIIF